MALDSLAEYRKRAGLTQKQVGDYIGISSQAISKWEKGQSEPDIRSLCKLAKLYNTTIDELAGNVLEEEKEKTEEKKESKFSALKQAVKRNKKKIVLISSVILGVLVATVTFLILRSALEDKIAYRKYQKIELGMTMEEVEAILGKPEETGDTHYESSSIGDALSAVFDEARYGHLDADFWYYRGQEYDTNLKSDLNYNWEHDFEPYYQIRVTFNQYGKVIEAYFNAETNYLAANDDYGSDDAKTLSSVEYLDGNHFTGEEAEKIRLYFEDGSAYLGELAIFGEYGNFSVEHPWGASGMLSLGYAND